MDVPQFNNSSIVGVWGFFFSFTNRDKTALNTCVQVIDVDINFHLIWVNSEGCSYWVICRNVFNFVRNCQTVFKDSDK